MENSRTTQPSLCFAWHGLPFYAAESLLALRRDGMEFAVIGSQATGAIRGSALDTALQPIWIDERQPSRFSSLGLGVPDVLYKTSWHHLAFEGLAAEVRAKGGAVIILADNTFAFSLRKVFGMFYARARLVSRHWGVLVPGSAARRFMRLLGFPSERIYTKLYCTNAEKFAPQSKKRYRRALFVGRFEPEKNIANLLAGWREYRCTGGQLEELVVVGRGSIQVRSDPEFGVAVSDWKPQDRIRELMQEAAVFVLPSRRDHWGVVLLEAALCGCVLVASQECGAAHDLIVSGENGVCFSGLSAAAIVRALQTADKLYSSAEALERAGMSSRRAGEAYSTAAFVAAVRSMSEAIASSTGNGE